LDETFPAGLAFEPIGVNVDALSVKKIASKSVEHLGHLLIPMSGLCGLEIGKSVIAPSNLSSERCQSREP
jgi:hypothetical protein